MKRDYSGDHDLLIDDEPWRLEQLAEFKLVVKYDRVYKGFEWNKEVEDIATRLWSELSDESQRKFERSKFGKQLGLNFDRLRAKGAE